MGSKCGAFLMDLDNLLLLGLCVHSAGRLKTGFRCFSVKNSSGSHGFTLVLCIKFDNKIRRGSTLKNSCRNLNPIGATNKPYNPDKQRPAFVSFANRLVINRGNTAGDTHVVPKNAEVYRALPSDEVGQIVGSDWTA